MHRFMREIYGAISDTELGRLMNLFFDIESIPDQREGALQEHIDNIAAPARYKKQESIDNWIKDKGPAAAVEQWKKTALEGISGQIVSIAWAFDKFPVTGEIDRSEDYSNESVVLSAFFDAIHDKVRAGEGKFQQLTWIAHNGIEFDLRFLYQRAVILGIKPPFVIPVDARHGSAVYDTMKAWAGYRGYVKQDVLYAAVGGEPFEDDDMDGSQVWDYIQAGRYDEVLEYNKRDVLKVRHIYQRLTWQ
jgi:predicted PolB exonuclease-like 3'-5' exonuclease